MFSFFKTFLDFTNIFYSVPTYYGNEDDDSDWNTTMVMTMQGLERNSNPCMCVLFFKTFLDYTKLFLQCFYLLHDDDDGWDRGQGHDDGNDGNEDWNLGDEGRARVADAQGTHVYFFFTFLDFTNILYSVPTYYGNDNDNDDRDTTTITTMQGPERDSNPMYMCLSF